MMTKTAYYMQMAQEAAAQITGSKEQWTAFLTTSARLYKYPFAEQLMIYKQRPEATACAEYDLWNDRMNRYVKRGSKGIALLDMRGEQPKLRYVFDVADTGERKNSRPVQLWKMNAEHEQPIIRALDVAFDVPAGAGSLENHIMEAAERLARDYWEENRRQISDIVADSYLEGYDELNIGASFKRAAAVSIAYSVFTRTVGNADDYFEHEDFLDIFDFNTQAAANVLGTAVSEMSSQIFREIERTIRTYEKDKQAERSQNYDGAELHEERRLPDSGYPVVGAGTEASGQVREDAQSVPAGEQHAAVQSPYPDREAVSAPGGDSGDRDRTDGADDGGASESESGTGQEIEPNGLGAAHEHAESAGRGSHSDGTYQQLNFMSLFQSEAEQIQKIDAAAENAAREAESEKPSAFVISEDEIDRMLRAGSNFEGGKIRIYALYQQQGDAKERAAFLKAEYGLGGHSYTFMDGSRGFADYNGRGILLRNYDHDREVRLTWSAVDQRVDRLVENDQYLTALEMEAAVNASVQQQNIFIGCAAVADYRAATVAPEKIKKQATQGDELTIKMVKNPDIVAGVAALKDHRPYVVGFAAETNNVEEYARQKRIRKNLDLICANDVSQPTQGFNSDNNALHLFWQDGDKVLPLERKELLGQLLLDEIVTRYDEKNRR